MCNWVDRGEELFSLAIAHDLNSKAPRTLYKAKSLNGFCLRPMVFGLFEPFLSHWNSYKAQSF